MFQNISVPFDAEYPDDIKAVSPVFCDHLKVLWALDNQFYQVTVQLVNDIEHCTAYDDRDQ